MKASTVFICFFDSSKNNFGAANVTFNFFSNWPGSKKLFQYSKIKNSNNHENINILFNNFFFKILFLPIMIGKIYKYFKKKNNKIVVIEGASWALYSFLSIKLIKFFIKNTKIIYHSHNLEIQVRKFPILHQITKYFEKKIYQLADIPTAVSKDNQKIIKKTYNVKSYYLPNGYDLKKIVASKINLPKKFILFNGANKYWPNKEAIKTIFNNYYLEILNNNKDIYFVFTGIYFPEKYKILKNVIFFNSLNKNKYKYLLKKTNLLLLPLPKAPGTKIKIIEGLSEGIPIVGSKCAFDGILKVKNNNLIKNIKTKKITIKSILDLTKRRRRNNKISKIFRQHYDYKKIIKKFINDKQVFQY